MNNKDLDAAWEYHNGTKHSLLSVHNDPHFLDFHNQPIPFKIYSGLEGMPLTQRTPTSGMPALDAMAAIISSRDGPTIPDLDTLSSIFHYSVGITKRVAFHGGEMMFRAAACTGALYHIDLYLICGDLPGLDAGVYHFGPHDSGLRKLRDGDHRRTLADASGEEPSIMEAPAVVVYAGTFWRNAWKYRSRTYRHCFWDSGTILANFLATSTAHHLPARVVLGFADEPVNQLLGLDTMREVALALVPLGRSPTSYPSTAPEAQPLDLDTIPLSKHEVDYPEVRAIHEASSLTNSDEASEWRGQTPKAPMPAPSGRLFPLSPPATDNTPPDPVEQVIQRRGSSRRFLRKPIPYQQLSSILQQASRGISADFLDPEGVMLNDIYLVVNAVDGLPAGGYVFLRDKNALELLNEGESRNAAGYLGLQQAIPADASVNVFFLTDLKPILERYGNRGYRAAQLEAGIVGGKLYLAAYAHRLGASGLTFFDDDVTNYFSPHAEGKSVMFLVALGVPLKRRVLQM